MQEAGRAWRFTWEAAATPAGSPPPPMAGWMPEPVPAWVQALDLRFTGLAAQARVRHAAWQLIETGLSLAEIGFLCGYADQAHFTRDFGRRVGLSPERYRVAFRRGKTAHTGG